MAENTQNGPAGANKGALPAAEPTNAKKGNTISLPKSGDITPVHGS